MADGQEGVGGCRRCVASGQKGVGGVRRREWPCVAGGQEDVGMGAAGNCHVREHTELQREGGVCCVTEHTTCCEKPACARPYGAATGSRRVRQHTELQTGSVYMHCTKSDPVRATHNVCNTTKSWLFRGTRHKLSFQPTGKNNTISSLPPLPQVCAGLRWSLHFPSCRCNSTTCHSTCSGIEQKGPCTANCAGFIRCQRS